MKRKLAWLVVGILFVGFICSPCFAEKEWDGYKVGDTYFLENGDGCIVTEIMMDGVKCDMGLYKEAKRTERLSLWDWRRGYEQGYADGYKVGRSYE